MAKKYEIDFNIKNFGPHEDLKFNGAMNIINIGIFANNGAGKTFISRAFKLASPSTDIKNMETSETDNILSTNQKKGKFVFKTLYQDHGTPTTQEVVINLIRGSKPSIKKSNLKYLFHVFNSDYVSENLEAHKYNPNGNEIQGYILGKARIEVTKEKRDLNKLLEEKKSILNSLKECHEKDIEELDNLKISKLMKDYNDFKNFEKVINGINVTEEKSFESLKELHQNLESMPDDIKDVTKLDYFVDGSPLNNIETLLLTPFDKSRLHKEFVNKIRSEKDFIEKGMELYHSNNNQNCPFCKTKLKKRSINILKQYDQYISDSEAKAIKEIEEKIESLNQLKEDIKNHYIKFYEINSEFNKVKQFLPSHIKKELQIQDNTIALTINELIEMLKIKKSDVTLTDFDLKSQTKVIVDFLHELETEVITQSELIEALNTDKNSKKDEIRELKRSLCKAKYLEFRETQKDNFEKIKKLNSEIKELNEIIEEKENKAKIDKKQEVIKSLKYFLNFFFRKKYTFDDKEFCIKFREKTLSENATHVLSDGEKGIVAFCYYLATTHMIIKKKEDYENLFFVIDDPISSMDFNFLYAVAQSIRKIKDHFNIRSRINFIILTHNYEFMNLLNSTKITNKEYMLKNKRIEDVNDKLMLPYESHLSDIVGIVKEGNDPSHTTANSIRHVLETICGFESPNKSLKKFVSEKEELDNKGIYCLINDLSHGKPRSEPITDETIKDACDSVVNYISKAYPEQIPEDT